MSDETKLIKNQQLSFSDDFWTDPKLRRKLEKSRYSSNTTLQA